MNQREASNEYSRIKRCLHAVHNKWMNDCDDLIFIRKLISLSRAMIPNFIRPISFIFIRGFHNLAKAIKVENLLIASNKTTNKIIEINKKWDFSCWGEIMKKFLHCENVTLINLRFMAAQISWWQALRNRNIHVLLFRCFHNSRNDKFIIRI